MALARHGVSTEDLTCDEGAQLHQVPVVSGDNADCVPAVKAIEQGSRTSEVEKIYGVFTPNSTACVSGPNDVHGDVQWNTKRPSKRKKQ